MNTLNDYIAKYIEYCEYRKRLDSKTLKAYSVRIYRIVFLKIPWICLSPICTDSTNLRR